MDGNITGATCYLESHRARYMLFCDPRTLPGPERRYFPLSKTSRSLLWRIVKFAVTQMPSIHELDRVSDQHDVAFYWHVSQRSRTRFSHTRSAAQSAAGWR